LIAYQDHKVLQERGSIM